MKVRMAYTAGLVLGLVGAEAGAVTIVPAELAATAVPVVAPLTPEEVVASGIGALEDFVADGDAGDPAALDAFLREAIAPLFDFAGMSRWAAGPIYRRLPAAGRERLAERVSDLFLGALAHHLGTYSEAAPDIDLHALRPLYRGQAHVRARVNTADGAPLVLDFRLYRKDGDWRVFDVSANGNSAATYYRALLRREWRRDNLQSLLAP